MRILSLSALAAVVLTVGQSVAYAGEGGPAANTQFTQIPGVVAQAPVQNAPNLTAQNGQGVRTYSTRSSQGTWLFPPEAYGG
jgi:hypothetical protein